MINLARCAGSCNTLDDLSSTVCVPNKTENLNWHVFNMITGICKTKALTKHVSYKCECTFNFRKYKFNQKSNNDKCWCECKHRVCEKLYLKF